MAITWLEDSWNSFKDSYKNTDANKTGKYDMGQIYNTVGMLGTASGLMGGTDTPTTGYQGGVPDYTVQRTQVPNTYDPNRRPGSSGQNYFTPTRFTTPETAITDTQLQSQAEGLATLNAANPARQQRPAPVVPPPVTTMAQGGIARLAKGRYLNGATDGMADKVPARIDGVQEARLSDGEFVIPADVVSHLGNGNSEAGAKILSTMMDRIRKERTGNKKQGTEIDPKEFLPV